MKKILIIEISSILGMFVLLLMLLCLLAACMPAVEEDYTTLENNITTHENIKTIEPQDTETMSQKNAIESAKNYLSWTAFSKTGLIEQLEFEGYTLSDSAYAVEKLNIDFNEQAIKSAKSYLEWTSFSKKGLIEQLEFDGYTEEQATYAADKIYK